MQRPGLGVCHPIQQAISLRGKSISVTSAYAHHTPIYISIYILIPPKFDFRPKGTGRPKGNMCKEQAQLPLGLLPNLEMNTHFYIQDTGKVQFYIGPAHLSPKPPLGYIASSYTHTLCICKPPMFSVNHKSTHAYARCILMQEKQRVGPTTPSTGLKCRVSISPTYVWHTLTMCTTRPNSPRRL